MIPPPDPTTGYLPLGRHSGTFDELETVFGTNTHRLDLISDLKAAISIYEDYVSINRIWIAGSFITTKPLPGDIDANFFISQDALDNLTDARKRAELTELAYYYKGPIFKSLTGLKVDAYPIVHVTSADDNDPELKSYRRYRGFWDDWWERSRATGYRQHQGYVEVIINEL